MRELQLPQELPQELVKFALRHRQGHRKVCFWASGKKTFIYSLNSPFFEVIWRYQIITPEGLSVLLFFSKSMWHKACLQVTSMHCRTAIQSAFSCKYSFMRRLYFLTVNEKADVQTTSKCTSQHVKTKMNCSWLTQSSLILISYKGNGLWQYPILNYLLKVQN